MQTRTYECSLVLIGHGATGDAAAAEPVSACADRLRGRFVDVGVGLLKAPGSIVGAVASATADVVVVVPFLMADGWTAREHLPRKLGLGGAEGGEAADPRVVLTGAIGASPAMVRVVGGLVDREAPGAGGRVEPSPPDCVLLVAHGTARDPRSGDAVRACARALGAADPSRAVEYAFIDDAPDVASWVAATRHRDVVVVPFFAGLGPHVVTDVPRDLGLPPDYRFGEACTVDGRRVRYLAPVGLSASVDDAVIERVETALGAHSAPSSTTTSTSAPST